MDYNRIYFVGIGGIGMSALAQLFKHQRKDISGSDREESPVTKMLEAKGIKVRIGEGAGSIPKDTELIVYSDAVPEDNPERIAGKKSRVPEISYFEALGAVSKNARTIAVAGTHGKTTTAGMLSKILADAGKEPTAIIGSIVQDFGSNFLAGRADLFVVEACEYKDHLLKLSPEILVITNIELDHTDYFPDIQALQKTFRRAAQKIGSHGAIITSPGSPNVADVLSGAQARVFDYYSVPVPKLRLIGKFNEENARTAKTAAKVAFPDIPEEIIDRSLENFRGSWRRFEYKGETPQGAVVYDDYAHHPTAVAKTIEAAREKFPDKRIVVAFHPHLYSRTKSFLSEFAKALAHADLAIIAPIYAAREKPDASISNHVLAKETRSAGGNAKALDSFDAIRDTLLAEKENAFIITMGAGDIYKVAEQISDQH